MKALITIVVLAALGGIFWLLFLRDPTFGVGDGAPIGTMKEIGSYLKDKGLKVAPQADPGMVKRYFGEELAAREGLVPTLYLDSVPGYRHLVLVVQDGSGKVVGVAGQFRSEMLEFSKMGAKSTAFIAKLWLAVAGKEPKFVETRFGPGAADVHLQADWTGTGAAVTWKKFFGSDLKLARETADEVVFRVK